MKTNTISDIASYLTFKLGMSFYAVPISKVLNIVEMSSVTSIHGNNLISGTINFRGTFLPVTDARPKFGIIQEEYNNKACVLIIEILNQFEKLVVGIIIEALLEVMEIKRNEITANNYLSKYPIFGVFRKDKYMSLNIIDQDILFSKDEILTLEQFIAKYK